MDSEYFVHKGIHFASIVYSKERLEFLEDEFQVQDDDVYIVTFPKSGTNWMMEIVSLIHSNGDVSWCLQVPNYVRIPWIDVCGPGTKMVDAMQSPRFFSSHLPIQFFPKSFFSSKAKVIYIARNPKDVLVSLYHFAHMAHLIKTPNSFDEFMEDFLHGEVPFGSWFDHIKGWIQMKDKSNFFFITYEDLKKDHSGSVRKICAFLGKELEEQTIDLVVEHSSFNMMKTNKASNNSTVPDHIIDPKNNNFMRKGIIGDWKNHFTQKQKDYVDVVYQEKMKGVNVKFTWDENYDGS